MMELIRIFIEYILHLDKNLIILLQEYGLWIYLILFMIIFLETGLVITPFLPGDSLLFAIGALAASGALDVKILLVILIIAAILGDTVNYWIGYLIGPKIIHKRKIPFIRKEHLDKTHKFFEKYGNKTIILARFVPIIRTFAPFTAGFGSMKYSQFILYNIIGGVAWITIFILGGYFFGNLPIIKNNFTIVLLTIIFISFIPAIIEYIKHVKEKQNKKKK